MSAADAFCAIIAGLVLGITVAELMLRRLMKCRKQMELEG